MLEHFEEDPKYPMIENNKNHFNIFLCGVTIVVLIIKYTNAIREFNLLKGWYLRQDYGTVNKKL